MDQYWAQVIDLIERDPRGSMNMIDALRRVAQDDAILQIEIDSHAMRQICWFAVAAMTEGVYRAEVRKQEVV